MPDVCAVIPVFEHAATAGRVVEAARHSGLPVFLVDDGSSQVAAESLDALARSVPGVRLLRHSTNLGKGAAVQTGLRAAAAQGHTHAIQVDADGQHALGDLPRFLAEARALPDALVCGQPVFNADAPRARLYGRRFTNFWVSVHTWSTELPDAMCGYRVYPLAATMPLIERSRLGSRMDFDIEILVRLYWLGVPVRWLATAVSYPEGGVSHFRMRRDNVLIARAHTLLFFGMLARAPLLAARKLGIARSRYRVA